MAIEIKMPQLSDTMDSGKIISWNKNEGDQITRGDILAEVETDKANLEIESFHNGVLLKITTPADDTAVVGGIIAYIGEAGEEISESPVASEAPSTPEQPEPQETVTETASPTPQAETHTATNSSRIKASPLAKKIAEQKNIDLGKISGTGPQGRIVKKDLDSTPAQQSSGAQAPTQTSQASAPSPSPIVRQETPKKSGVASTTEMTKMRATIGKRMQQSVVEAPHFYVTTSVDMSEVMKLRAILKPRGGYEGISINHFIMKATAYGLANEPRVNCAVRDGNMVYDPGQINIGIIMALPDGLIIPVLHNVSELSLKDTVFDSRALLERARAGRPTSQDLSGGTFSISNLGMFDVETFTAIINPGQGSILAVSSILDQPIVKNNMVVPGKIMKVTVSVDHRIIDGVMAGTFLKFFKEGLENPALLMN